MPIIASSQQTHWHWQKRQQQLKRRHHHQRHMSQFFQKSQLTFLAMTAMIPMNSAVMMTMTILT
jgi:hypothetical protein